MHADRRMWSENAQKNFICVILSSSSVEEPRNPLKYIYNQEIKATTPDKSPSRRQPEKKDKKKEGKKLRVLNSP